MRLCSGCQSKIPDDAHGLCESCRSAKQHRPDGMAEVRSHNSADRDSWAHFYSCGEWTVASKRQLKAFPVCERCQINFATLTDHFIPVGQFIALCREQKRFLGSAKAAFFYSDNFQSLCNSCHTTKTNEDKEHTGPWPDIFANPRRARRTWSF